MGGLWAAHFSESELAGNGRLTQPDGSYCEGSWKEGSRIHGRWVSADKRQEYLGDWLQDKKHGQGTLHMKGLLQYTGTVPSWCQSQLLGGTLQTAYIGTLLMASLEIVYPLFFGLEG